MSTLCKGLNLSDRYVLNEFIGQGSFGEVWLAYDEVLSEDVAIKLYSSLDPDGIDEFKQEFYTTARIQHPNLLVAKQFNQWENRPFLVMQYCRAGSSSNLAGLIDEASLWKFIRDVSAGLAYLHTLPEPIIHQDIKPDNILVGDDGEFLISDFGISRRLSRTMERVLVHNHEGGAVAYMAPERFGEEPELSVAGDVWSLGVSIYELATGKLPFTGMGGSMLRNGAAMPHLPVPWSKNLNKLMTACLDKDPDARPTAGRVCEYAEAILRGEDDPECPWMMSPVADEVLSGTPAQFMSWNQEAPAAVQKSKRPRKNPLKGVDASIGAFFSKYGKSMGYAALVVAALVVLGFVAVRVFDNFANSSAGVFAKNLGEQQEMVAQDLGDDDDEVVVDDDLGNFDDDAVSAAPAQASDPSTTKKDKKAIDDASKYDARNADYEEDLSRYARQKDPNSIPATRAALPLNGKATSAQGAYKTSTATTRSASTSTRAGAKPIPADKATALASAINSGDYATVKQLADQNYSDAYGPLAMHYLKNHNYKEAERYGRKAQAAGSSQGNEVMNYLQKSGYYD